jgi:hypothetical protein
MQKGTVTFYGHPHLTKNMQELPHNYTASQIGRQEHNVIGTDLNASKLEDKGGMT